MFKKKEVIYVIFALFLVFISLFLVNSAYSYSEAPTGEGDDDFGLDGYGRNGTSCSRLELEVMDPKSEEYVTLTTKQTNEDICEHPKEGVCGDSSAIMHGNQFIEIEWGSFLSICRAGNEIVEGDHVMRLKGDGTSILNSNSFMIEYNDDEAWCRDPACGRGDWLETQNNAGLKEACCSPREMNSDFEYTNEDCNKVSLVGRELCYIPYNPINEQLSEGAWLRGDKLQGEIIYEGCGDNPDTNKEDGREYVADTEGDWLFCSEDGFHSSRLKNDGSIISTNLNKKFVQISGIDAEDNPTNEHGYACLDWRAPGQYSIVECNSNNREEDDLNLGRSERGGRGGLVARGGYSVNLSDGNKGKVYYCSDKNTWVDDLDNYENVGESGVYCNNARYPDADFSSGNLRDETLIGSRWTGSYCCGELDDTDNVFPDTSFTVNGEYYNDDDRRAGVDGSGFEDTIYPGACFNGLWQRNESFLKIKYDNGEKEAELSEVMVWHGNFEGCAIEHGNAMPDNVECASSNNLNKPYEGSAGALNLIEYGAEPNSNDFLVTEFYDSPNSKRKLSGDKLINDNDYCTIKNWSGERSFFCSYGEKWVANQDPDKPRNHLSFIPWINNSPDLQQAECCYETECWDGEQCISSIKDNMDPVPYKVMNDRRDGFTCNDGDWQWTYKKRTWDGTQEGYCYENTQCLVSPDGDPSPSNNQGILSKDVDEISEAALPMCINNGEFYLDHYCDNGSWTTRTKYLALELFSVVDQDSNDYTLYCDTYDKVLNYFDYNLIGDYQSVDKKYFKVNPASLCMSYDGQNVPCANHVCALIVEPESHDPDVYFGVSINHKINTTASSGDDMAGYDVANAFGTSLDGCLGNIDEDDFISCTDVGDNLLVNPKKKILIFSRSGANFGNNYFNIMNSLFDSFIRLFVDELAGDGEQTPGFDFSVLQDMSDGLFHDYDLSALEIPDFECNINGSCRLDGNDGEWPSAICGERGNPRMIYDLNTLYISKSGSKSIFGMAEYEADFQNIPNLMYGVMFEGFGDNVCDSFDNNPVRYRVREEGDKCLVTATTMSVSDLEISYENLVDRPGNMWEQWVFMSASNRIASD